MLVLKIGTTLVRIKGWTEVLQSNETGDKKATNIVTLIHDKIDFQLKLLRRDKERHLILIKETINQEDIAILNIYAPNFGAPNFI